VAFVPTWLPASLRGRQNMLSDLLVDFPDSGTEEAYFIEATATETRISFRVASASRTATPAKELISRATLSMTIT
jgi:hypothetical protein